MDIEKLVALCSQRLISYRRRLHERPELSMKEYETSRFIRERLKEAGVPMLEGIRGNSVVGRIDFPRPGKTVAFRADFDALPIEENNFDLPYRSKNPGVMHACGHDAHTAILLCLAETLAGLRRESPDALSGSAVFLFQQAEEDGGGAKYLVEDGAIDDAHMVFGLHVDEANRVGEIEAVTGPCHAAVDAFKLTITSSGCHGAHPDRAPDPIACGAMIMNELQYIVSRYRNPLKPLVITVGEFQAGTANNIIPKEAYLHATVRTYDRDLRRDVERWIRSAIEHICAMRGCGHTLEYTVDYPALINDADAMDVVRRAAGALGIKANGGEPSMGAEDFAYYAEKQKAGFFQLGTREETDSKAHTPDFRIDESALIYGLEMFLKIYELMQTE